MHLDVGSHRHPVRTETAGGHSAGGVVPRDDETAAGVDADGRLCRVADGGRVDAELLSQPLS
jgi:hypothetical protein